jgi:hypothetical protein
LIVKSPESRGIKDNEPKPGGIKDNEQNRGQ